jgi:RNA polymerase sigma factor (sigma-70 family)
MTADTRNLRLVPSPETGAPPSEPSAAETPSEAGGRFEDLVRKYAKLISFVVGRVSRGRLQSTAEDVEQQVLIALWKRTGNEQTIEYPSSYIYKAAVRETVRAVRRETERATLPIETHGAHLTSGDDPSHTLKRREIRERLDAAFGSMQKERAHAARLHLQGLTVDEIMRLNGWPYQKARNLIARGMADLRGLLSGAES